MKTILDNKDFRKAFKKRCIEQHIESFYSKAILKKHFRFSRNITVYLNGDPGDEVYDATYEALEDVGYINKEIGLKVSPYDVLKMEAVYDKVKNLNGEIINEYRGINVTFKTWCPNFGKDRTDRVACNIMPDLCGQYKNCGIFYHAHSCGENCKC